MIVDTPPGLYMMLFTEDVGFVQGSGSSASNFIPNYLHPICITHHPLPNYKYKYPRIVFVPRWGFRGRNVLGCRRTVSDNLTVLPFRLLTVAFPSD